MSQNKIIAATRLHNPCNGFTATGKASMNTRTFHKSPKNQAITDIKLCYSAWAIGTVSGVLREIDSSNDITVRSFLEYPAGNYHALYYDGFYPVPLTIGSDVVSDPCSITIPKDTGFWVHTIISVATAASMVFPLNYTCVSSLGEGSVSDTAYTERLYTLATNNNNGYGPRMILAGTKSAQSSVVVIGDSIAHGVGYDIGDTDGNVGYVARALQNEYGVLFSTMPNDRAALFNLSVPPLNYFRRMSRVGEYASHAIVQMGINDVGYAGATLASVKAELQKIWDILDGKGIKVYQTTLLPVSTSTDNWATNSNQTTHATNSIRTALNDFIRTTPAPLSGYFDAADAAETSLNSGIWKTTGSAFGYVLDGVHPNNAGAALIAATINPAVLV